VNGFAIRASAGGSKRPVLRGIHFREGPLAASIFSIESGRAILRVPSCAGASENRQGSILTGVSWKRVYDGLKPTPFEHGSCCSNGVGGANCLAPLPNSCGKGYSFTLLFRTIPTFLADWHAFCIIPSITERLSGLFCFVRAEWSILQANCRYQAGDVYPPTAPFGPKRKAYDKTDWPCPGSSRSLFTTLDG
jgi:hypothetical protein